MVYLDTRWFPKGLNRWGFDAKKPLAPQIAAPVLQVAGLLGGPLAAILAIDRYPALVEDGTIYAACLTSIGACFLVSVVTAPARSLPPKLPAAMRLMFRLGLALCMTGWLLAAALIGNGWRTPLVARDVPVIAKHETLQRDPARRAHYISARPWPGSRRVQDLDAPSAVYDALSAPVTGIHASEASLEAMPNAATVRLVLGQGRFGPEWIKQVRLPEAGGAQAAAASP